MSVFKPHAYLFVDGSCGPKEDIGGYAAIAVCATGRKVLYGTMYPTTISRCELMPIIEGLRWIKRNWARGTGFRVLTTSDSLYTVQTLCGINQRRKNEELWKAADDAAHGMVVKYIWRERNSLDYMELCDGICGAMRGTTIKLAKSLSEVYKTPETTLPACESIEQLNTIFSEGDTNGKAESTQNTADEQV